jgi:hypothetical protein
MNDSCFLSEEVAVWRSQGLWPFNVRRVLPELFEDDLGDIMNAAGVLVVG